MLYTVLPALTLCMTLLNGNNSDAPMVNVGMTSDDELGDNFKKYTNYLDAAVVLIQAAKQKEKEDSTGVEEGKEKCKSDDSFEASESQDEEELYRAVRQRLIAKIYDSSLDLVDENLLCPSRPIDCEELLVMCGFNASGMYRIWPRSRVDTGGEAGFYAYCDMETDGGGWTVFQRRDDFGTNSDFFYKNWLAYKYGFGHLNFDFWLGNGKIFALSNQRRSMLRIDLVDFANEVGYATYDSFYLDDESEGYRLHIGYYRGNIGDSFSGHNLCKFSTRDRDNDRNPTRQCALIYKGGWWYNDCHTANLNGLYLKGTHGSYADGVNWHGWRGFRYSLKKTEMKLRSSTFSKFLKPEDQLLLQTPEDQ